MHQQAKDWCLLTKARYHSHFVRTRVLDVGSLDVNGNNRQLFTDCDYTGIDVAAGPNVDIPIACAEHGAPDGYYDTIISTECFEHDREWRQSLVAIVRMLAPGGLFIFTAATVGRHEHGTSRSNPADCPGIPWDYYGNLMESDIRSAIDVDAIFDPYEFAVGESTHDLYWYGIKR